MPPRQRQVARGARTAARDLATIGDEIRTARLMAGLTMAQVGSEVGLSTSQVSRIERALSPDVPARHLARVGAAVGLDVRIKAFPGLDPIRDAAQQGLIDRLRRRLPTFVRMRTEVALPIDGDLRAWDAVLSGLRGGPEPTMPVEAETRVHDVQAQTRRIALKCRDGGVTSVVLLVADTRANRHAVRLAGPAISELFPVPARAALAALAAGRHPGASCLIFL